MAPPSAPRLTAALTEPVQEGLFALDHLGPVSGDSTDSPLQATPRHTRTRPAPPIQAAQVPAEVQALGQRLSPSIHLGTSSWSFPGWQGLVWADEYRDTALSRQGLPAYAAHPLLRTVSLDRSFYRPMSRAEYAVCAAQVPEDFRFIVKAPALVTDAQLRGSDGRGLQANPAFLDPAVALESFVQPAMEGLQHRIGALVFEISPLPAALKRDMPALLTRLAALLAAMPDLKAVAPDGVIAVEVRDPQWLQPAFRDVLKASGARYCLGLHPRLPPIEAQLPLLRAMWPGALVCRWSLNRRHGATGYETAKDTYAPFNRLVDPDPDTRHTLARIIHGTTTAGHPAYVSINNKAEGSAPLSVLALAQALDDMHSVNALK